MWVDEACEKKIGEELMWDFWLCLRIQACKSKLSVLMLDVMKRKRRVFVDDQSL